MAENQKQLYHSSSVWSHPRLDVVEIDSVYNEETIAWNDGLSYVPSSMQITLDRYKCLIVDGRGSLDRQASTDFWTQK
jgi:hypothetical protein